MIKSRLKYEEAIMGSLKKKGVTCFLGATVFSFASGVFLFATEQGIYLRHMIAGSILTSQHPQYAKYIVGDEEADKLQKVRTPKDMTASKQIELSSNNITSSDITIETVENSNFTAKIMIIDDPRTVHLVGTTKPNGQTLNELLQENEGVGGVNAGGYVKDEGVIAGIAISDGEVISNTALDEKRIVAGFKKDGSFLTGFYSSQELMDLGVIQAASFGPQLIVNGESKVSSDIEEAYGWAPRTAIGQREDGKVVMLVTDGRFYHNKMHRGASMQDLVNLFQQYEAINAMALDGGGSSTMIYDDELQMNPTTDEEEGMRKLPTAFIIIPKEKVDE